MRIPLFGLALLFAFFSYANSLGNDFVWDDQGLILENPNVQSFWGFLEFFTGSIATGTTRESPYYRPLYMFSFWLDTQVWGLHPFGFHLTNLFLHLLNTLLVYVFVGHLSIRRWSAFFAALFFAVHPAQTEAIASISGRGWPLATLFLLVMLLCFIAYRRQDGRPFLFIALLCFLLALLTMEIAMIFPPLLLLYDAFNAPAFREKKSAQALLPHIPFWGILLIFCLLRLTVLRLGWFSFGGDWEWQRRILTAPLIFFSYLGILLFPMTLRLERTLPFATRLGDPLVLLSWIGLLAFAGLIFILIRKQRTPLFVFGLLWMCIALIPALNIVPLRAMMAEAWLYVPTLGFAITLSSVWMQVLERFPKWGGTLAVCLILFFMVRTILRNHDWRDNITLYEVSVRDSPSSVKMQYNLAAAYSQAGRLEDSKREFQKIITEGKRYMRDYNRNFYGE